MANIKLFLTGTVCLLLVMQPKTRFATRIDFSRKIKILGLHLYSLRRNPFWRLKSGGKWCCYAKIYCSVKRIHCFDVNFTFFNKFACDTRNIEKSTRKYFYSISVFIFLSFVFLFVCDYRCQKCSLYPTLNHHSLLILKH